MEIADRVYVSLDLETTGLVPESDAIIEIGAVKFSRDGREIAEFQTLINPRRPLPYHITRLCDISQGDVDAAPVFSTVADELTAFLEGCVPVGHNVSFDLNFLSRKGIALPGPVHDTYDLAKLLMPELTERSLSAVALKLGIPHPSAHRAMADARVAKQVFIALLARLDALDPAVLREMARLTADTEWWASGFLSELAKARETVFVLGDERSLYRTISSPPAARSRAKDQKVSLDIDQLEGFLDPEGLLARSFPEYEERREQRQMMKAVAEALNENQHLIVEAGTGTGKSMAYLLPSAIFACQNDLPVVVSTNTLNLQDQLMHKDIPDLARAIRPVIGDMRVVQVKGRTNYLCLRRWETVRKMADLGPEMVQLLARIQVWLPSTGSGDRSELNLDGREVRLWPRVSSQGYDCPGRLCPYHQRGLCFLHRARSAAEDAHLIVVNHALLLSEMAAGAQILPEYSHLIIDEAHNFEDVATDQLGAELREEDITAHLDQISHQEEGRETGFVTQMAHALRHSDLHYSGKGDLDQLLQSLGLGVARVRDRASQFFNALGDVLQHHGEGRGEYDLQLRITESIRAQPGWSEVEIHCENLILALGDTTKPLARIQGLIESLPVKDILKFESLSLLNANEELEQQLKALIFQTAANRIHWLTLGRKSNVIGMHSAPLHVGSILQESLYSRKDCLVLTGATLSTEGTFSYIKERLGMETARELILGSSFDYQRSALIYLADDLPEPGRMGYQESLARALVPLCRATEGRCLVLFTSHSALRAAKAGIQSALEQDDILVLAQGADGSPKKLIAALKSNPRTVILGAASFWEGVDVVGEALSVLVIVRLPFAVPSDPVFAARADTFQDPFNEYALPKTAFRFKQGFGRLIRSKTDRGVMAVLDSRLGVRNYSQVFLTSLPPCRVQKGPVRDLPDAARKWLQRGDEA